MNYADRVARRGGNPASFRSAAPTVYTEANSPPPPVLHVEGTAEGRWAVCEPDGTVLHTHASKGAATRHMRDLAMPVTPTQLFPVELPEMIAEVRREIVLRQRVYPEFVRDRKITARRAARQIEIMEAVLDTLIRLDHPTEPQARAA